MSCTNSVLLPRDAVHSAASYAVVRGPSVRSSVCPSVTFVYCIQTSKLFSRTSTTGYNPASLLPSVGRLGSGHRLVGRIGVRSSGSKVK